MEYLAVALGVLSGVCLTAVAIRKRIPLFGGLFSSKMRTDLDKTDKQLALAALALFILCIAALIASESA